MSEEGDEIIGVLRYLPLILTIALLIFGQHKWTEFKNSHETNHHENTVYVKIPDEQNSNEVNDKGNEKSNSLNAKIKNKKEKE